MLRDKFRDQAFATVELVSTCRNRFGALTTLTRILPFPRLVQIMAIRAPKQRIGSDDSKVGCASGRVRKSCPFFEGKKRLPPNRFDKTMTTKHTILHLPPQWKRKQSF